MRVAVISDIHANLAAFEAVIADWGTVDAVWHLGDVVGYGPDPLECIERLRGLPSLGIAGNHDWAAIGRIDTSTFNQAAAEAIAWTAGRLTPDAVAYLEQLPCIRYEGDFTLAHGSPRDPIWEYVLSVSSARESFEAFTSAVCFIGHSHIPLAFSVDPTVPAAMADVRVEPVVYDEIALGNRRHLINVGSVGQPRDHDPAARYAILDTDRRASQRRRVEYPIVRTQQRMREAGLPTVLWARLAYGR